MKKNITKKQTMENPIFFKDMIDKTIAGGLFVDVDRNIKYCNQRIEQIFGYPASNIVGKRTEFLYKDRRKKKNTNEIYEALERDGFHTGKAAGLTKDGKEIDLFLSTFVVRPHKGAVILLEEVEDSKEKAIDKSILLQNLLDSVPDMIYFKDLKGKFILVNKAHAATKGLMPDQVIGKSDLDFFPPKIAKGYLADDENIVKTGSPVIGKIESAPRPDGGVTYVSTTKIPHYDTQGKIVGIIGITRNITDQMIAEEELRVYKDNLEDKIKERTKELEENNKKLLHMYNIKSEFTSVVSHELRTPLGVMKEAVALVEDGTLGGVNDKQKETLEIAIDNMNRLGRLINDILDFSKLETKKVKFKVVEGNLNAVIDQVIRSYRATIEEKGLKLYIALEPTLPLVRFDRDRVIQVLYNLINNAVKFTDKGSITVTSSFDGINAVVSIKDTGRGIKRVDLPRIFERFEQLYTDEGTRKQGTGLGLTICKHIIEQLGGRIWVESEYSKGSTFSFTLPVSS